MSDNAPADLFIAALEDLRLGVTLDRHNLPDGDVKIAALDAAMAVLRQRLSLDASQARAWQNWKPPGLATRKSSLPTDLAIPTWGAFMRIFAS
jgi:hypothetical protein